MTGNSHKVKADGLALLLEYIEVTQETSPEFLALYSNAINVAAFNDGTENLDLEYTPITSEFLLPSPTLFLLYLSFSLNFMCVFQRAII